MGGGAAPDPGSADNVSSLGGGSFGVFGNMGQDWEDLFSEYGLNPTGTGGGTGGTAGSSSAYGYQPTSAGSMYMGSEAGYGGSGQSAPIYGQDIYDPTGGIFSGSGSGGGIDQTVYNPGTDQSQYNYGIPDYYGTGYDSSGGDYYDYGDYGGDYYGGG
jgi:hypothetical protein